MKYQDIKSSEDLSAYMAARQRAYKSEHPERFKKGGKHYETTRRYRNESKVTAHNDRCNYTEADDRLILDRCKNDTHVTDREIARVIGRSINAIQTRRRRLRPAAAAGLKLSYLRPTVISWTPLAAITGFFRRLFGGAV